MGRDRLSIGKRGDSRALVASGSESCRARHVFGFVREIALSCFYQVLRVIYTTTSDREASGTVDARESRPKTRRNWKAQTRRDVGTGVGLR